jgi:hypothetical protein
VDLDLDAEELAHEVARLLMTAAFFWVRPATGYLGAVEVGGLLAALLHVYPRFWHMWIQTTFPNRLLLVEVWHAGLSVHACFRQA